MRRAPTSTVPTPVQLFVGSMLCLWLTTITASRSDLANAATAPPTPCPSGTDIISALDSASYACADSMIGHLSAKKAEAFITYAFKVATAPTSPTLRLHALDALGKFCWAGNKYCNTRNRKWLLPFDHMMHKRGPQFVALLQDRIMSEYADANLATALKLARDGNWAQGMKNTGRLKARLNQLACDERLDATIRFSANELWRELVESKKGTLNERDIIYLGDCLDSWDMYLRRSCAYTAKEVFHQIAKAHQPAIIERLRRSLAEEDDLLTKVNMAAALDVASKVEHAVRRLRMQYERRNLHRSFKLDGGHALIRSSDGMLKSECNAVMIERARDAYFHLFQTSGKGKSKDILQIFIFPSPEQYGTYMNTFIGQGGQAGGIYLHQFNNTLYTFQRSDDRNYLFQKKRLGAVGWLDEGMAEYMAGLNFNQEGCFSAPVRENYMIRTCRQNYTDWDLMSLLKTDKGYGTSGTFHYQRAYSLIHFLTHSKLSGFRNFLSRVRRGQYNVTNLFKDVGVSAGKLQHQWYEHIKMMCKGASTLPHYQSQTFVGIKQAVAAGLHETSAAPTCSAKNKHYNSLKFKHCTILGHGPLSMDLMEELDLGQPSDTVEIVHELGVS